MKVLPLAARSTACALLLLGLGLPTAARADIANFTLVGIEGVGDLDKGLSDRLGTTLNATEHFINIDDCEAYAGGEMDVTVRIPSSTVKYQYALAYAPPDKTCPTTDANPEGIDGQCYVVAAQEDLTTTELTIRVNFDDLIGSACDSGDEGTATVYVILAESTGTTVNFEKVDFIIDLDPPAAPEVDKVTTGDARFEVSWTDDINDSTDVTYTVYWSDAPFTDADLEDVDKNANIDGTSIAIESGIDNGVEYYVSVVADDEADNRSPLSNQLTVTPAETQDFWERYQSDGGTDPGGFCFIATAAYGTPMSQDLGVLRAFRDQMLEPTEGGAALVDAYYTYGRRWASWIADKPALRAVVRVALVPLVFVARVVLALGPYASFVLLLAAIGLVRHLRRRALAHPTFLFPVARRGDLATLSAERS